jgi:ADP-heptose:LPS heptosyltransferase
MDMTEGPRLTISMLALNQVALTRRCVESIFANTSGSFELLVHDNGSTDETPAYLSGLAAAHPGQVIMTRSDRNEGFIVPHNRNAKKARGQFFCALNNDVVVGPDWSEKLIAPFNQDPLIGATGPQDDYGYLAETMTGCPVPAGKEQEYISGHCLLVPRWIIRLHGLFDEQLGWATCEDSDFSLRIRAAGYRIHAVMDAPVTHVKRATMDHVGADLLGYDPIENEAKNHRVVQQRWSSYLRTRKFPARRILVRRDSAFGDVLCAEPIVRGLKEKYPNSQITFLTKNPWGDAIKGCPVIDRFTVDGAVLRETFDDVFDLNDGYEKRPKLSIVNAFAEIAGVPVDRPRWYLDAEGHRMAALLPADRSVCVVSTEAGWPMRAWTKVRFQEIARRLVERFLVIEVGTRESYLGIGWNLCRRTTLQELAGIYSRAQMAVMCDSLHVHLAACFQVPTVGIWGGTDPALRVHGPEHVAVVRDGLPCRACHHERSAPRHESSCDCGRFRELPVLVPLNDCMDVSVETVWEAVRRILP